ncbi:MAG TPA: ABC transporter substrate-binding protein [Candidatus Elarobacter sp.]|jgi:ABC-type nitrate/sulfonate/bicarbonate transport system substrate-binding protein|nr:ABC transporter substrate-binding protein [Candidatus Elarobacter sp.]
MPLSRRRFVQTAAAASVAPALAPGVVSAAGVTQLNVGSIGHSIAHFPLWVGAQQGYFQQNGVDIGKVTEFSTGALVGTAVTAGSLDVGSSVITDVFSLAKAGRSVKVLSVSAGSYYIDIVASKAFLQASKLSERSSIGDKIRAMRGKNIGVTGPGSGTEALVLYLLKLGGIDRTRDVQLVNVGANIPSVLATLRTGRVDMVSFAWPLGQQAQVEDIGEPFISPARGDLPEMTHEIQGVVFTTQDEIDKKHDAMVGFVRGYAKACTTILKDPARTRELLKSFYPNLDQKALDLTLDVYRSTSVSSNPMPSEVGFLRAIKFHQAAGLITEPYAYNDIVATKVIADALRKR